MLGTVRTQTAPHAKSGHSSRGSEVCRDGGTEDTNPSKGFARKGVRVRIPLPVPITRAARPLPDPQGVYRLEIACGADRPSPIAEAATAISAIRPAVVRRAGAEDRLHHGEHLLQALAMSVPAAPVRTKHRRQIELADWLQEIVDLHTETFLRVLIHSDGCRSVDRGALAIGAGSVGRIPEVLLHHRAGRHQRRLYRRARPARNPLEADEPKTISVAAGGGGAVGRVRRPPSTEPAGTGEHRSAHPARGLGRRRETRAVRCARRGRSRRRCGGRAARWWIRGCPAASRRR